MHVGRSVCKHLRDLELVKKGWGDAHPPSHPCLSSLDIYEMWHADSQSQEKQPSNITWPILDLWSDDMLTCLHTYTSPTHVLQALIFEVPNCWHAHSKQKHPSKRTWPILVLTCRPANLLICIHIPPSMSYTSRPLKCLHADPIVNKNIPPTLLDQF